MENTGGKRVWRSGLALFALALALRVLHLVAISRSSPFFDVLPGDLAAYDRWALRILEEGWIGRDIFYQDPLYPYFLAAFYKIFGRDFFWVYLAQGLMGAEASALCGGASQVVQVCSHAEVSSTATLALADVGELVLDLNALT